MSRSAARRALCLAIAGGALLTLLASVGLASAHARPHAAHWWKHAPSKYRKFCKVQHGWTRWHWNSQSGLAFSVSGDASQPALATSDQDCAALAVWATSAGGVAARFVDGDGRPISFTIKISASGDSPDVVYNDDKDEFLVVWSQAASSAAEAPRTIHVQRLSASGGRLGGDREISTPDTQYLDRAPSVAWSPKTDEYLVAWAHTFHEFPSITVRAQRLAWNAAQIGADDFVLDSTEYRAPSDIAVDPATGRWFVVWETNAEGPFSFIRGKLIDPDGTQGQAVEVSGRPGETFGYADDPAVAFNEDDGEYLIVWSDPNNRGASSSSDAPRAILGQRVATSGALVGPDRFVVAPALTNPGDLTPAVDYDTNHREYLVAWQEATTTGDAARVVGQFLDGSGAAGGAPLQLSVPSSSGQAMFPALAFSGTARSFLAAWQVTGAAGASPTPTVVDRAVR